MDETELLQRSSELLGVPILDADRFPVDIRPLDGLSPLFLKEQGVLPLGLDGSELQLAVAVPVKMHVLDALTQYTSLPYRLCLARREHILAGIDRVYGDYRNEAGGAESAGDGGSDDDLLGEDDLEALKLQAEDAPVVRLVQLIVTKAIEARASDIHLEIYQNVFRVRYRIDGVLHDVESPPRRMFLPVISHLKLRARMNIAERRLPQDGRIKMQMEQREIDMRVSTVPVLLGESMVIRILDQGAVDLDMRNLGFADEVLRTFRHYISQPHGMVLVTGPTGSGKTTSLYAALTEINTLERKIITVEDPVEYQIEGINQIQVKPQIDLTFAAALRSIVRQDPDVIMVGEIRDRETAEIAIQSALTGHLVFSTLHTNDSFSAAHRLLDMGVESYLIASSVLMVLAQRLVRMICPHCRQAVPLTDMDRLLLDQEGFDGSAVTTLYKGAGCRQCAQTGYTGRTGIYELMPMGGEVKEAILKRLPAEAVRACALREGVKTMRADGMQKVLAGITTLDELVRVTRQEF